MSWIVAIVVGGIIGWVASMIMSTNSQMSIWANILIGVVGSLLGSWLFGSVLGVGSAQAAGTISLWGIVWGVIGAVVLVAILRVFRVFT